MGERKSACEREDIDSSAGEKHFSSQGVQSLSQTTSTSSLVSLELSVAEATGSSSAPNNA